MGQSTPTHTPNQPNGNRTVTVTVTEQFAAPGPGVPTRTEALAGAIRVLLAPDQSESTAANAAEGAVHEGHESSRLMAKKRALPADIYLNEEIAIGGEATTRGAFIRENLAAGVSRPCIDLFLAGWEQGRETERAEDTHPGRVPAREPVDVTAA